jgi:hypothetical protein
MYLGYWTLMKETETGLRLDHSVRVLLNRPNSHEVWAPIKGSPGYMISNLGKIRCLKRRGWREVQHFFFKSRGGKLYLKVDLSRARRGVLVHRLLCAAFHGPCPGYRVGNGPARQMVSMHGNDDGTDNRAENLRWGTQRENIRHRRQRTRSAAYA